MSLHGRSGYGEDSGYGGGRSGYSADRSYGGSGGGGYGRERDYGRGRPGVDRDGYYGDRDSGRDREVEEHQYRVQVANRRMEETSAESLRTLHSCLQMGSDTAEELDRQGEAFDRTERRLDEMQVDLEQSKKSMRIIKSPFGGVANYFARRKKVDAITDPKLPKGSQKQSTQQQQSKRGASSGPPSVNGLKSTGNATVDRNTEEMSKALYQLKGMGELIGEQLKDSNSQIDRIQYKMENTDTKIKGVNKDIRRQL